MLNFISITELPELGATELPELGATHYCRALVNHTLGALFQVHSFEERLNGSSERVSEHVTHVNHHTQQQHSHI
jgi:hypothetical protein